MKISDNIMRTYNCKESVLMISSYPDRNNRSIQKLNAVASYTDHLVPSLKTHLAVQNRRLIILAEVLDAPCFYEEDDVLVVRCWRRNNLLLFSDLRKVTASFTEISRIFVQFEFNMFGKNISTLVFVAFMLWLRSKGYTTTVLLHQVLLDIGELSGHLNLGRRSLKTVLLNIALRCFYTLVAGVSGSIVVHDTILRDRLESITTKHVSVIPHGLGEHKNRVSYDSARADLNIPPESFVVLCFGFITWYKGSDWIVDAFVRHCNLVRDNNLKLIMAGGKSANLQNEPHYQSFYQSVGASASLCENISITGFVPDEKVALYMSAADVCILPYRTQMSASGPLALALSFGKPFILSSNLRGVLATEDIKDIMLTHNVDSTDIIFDLKNEDLLSKLFYLQSHPKELAKLAKFSIDVSRSREWPVVARKFLNVIDA